MSIVRVTVLRMLLLVTILVRSGGISAQWTVYDSVFSRWPLIDTSEYIPSFYPGALDYNLMIAASKGYAAEIERLIEKGADINAETDEGATPLVFAVTNNRLAAVNTLLSYKSSLNEVTSNYETSLLIAVKKWNFEITEALIRAGAGLDYSDRQGVTPLHYASIYGYLDIVDLLLYYNASIDEKSQDGTTPLLASVWAGFADVADLLIQNGANMEARDNDGFTPFLMAAFFGDTLLMDLLFKKGVDIYAVNKSGHNALTLSIISNHIEATKILLRIGDRWSDNVRYSVNPYKVASKYRRKEIIPLLEMNNVPGQLKYEIDQVSLAASARFFLHDLYSGVSVSFKEPYLNSGFTAGVDMKFRYSRLLVKEDENLFYQYMSKGAVAYAGLFKDFTLSDRPDRFNVSFSTALMAGYSFGNMLKGTFSYPENKFMVIPVISLKWTKLNFSFNMGMEYMKTGFYHNGPVWLRIGCSYNHFFDKVRMQYKTIKWY